MTNKKPKKSSVEFNFPEFYDSTRVKPYQGIAKTIRRELLTLSCVTAVQVEYDLKDKYLLAIYTTATDVYGKIDIKIQQVVDAIDDEIVVEFLYVLAQGDDFCIFCGLPFAGIDPICEGHVYCSKRPVIGM